MTPREAWEELGPPISMHLAGDPHDYPVIVTLHLQDLQLYWFEDRIWQIQYGDHWQGTLWGIGLGASREYVKEVLGNPFLESEEMMLYTLPDIGFPIELRIYLDATGKITDFILYRSYF